MQVAQAREYVQIGAITSAFAMRDPVSGGWFFCLVGKDDRTLELRTARGEVRTFRTLDALVTTADEICGKISSINFSFL
jgi:hypothetical protein